MSHHKHILLKEIEALVGAKPRMSLPQLSQALSVERHTIEGVVRLEAGKAFRKWRQVIVMKKAARALTESNLGIKEVAYELGYQSPSAFSRAFHSYHGMKPSDFRNAVVHDVSIVQKDPGDEE